MFSRQSLYVVPLATSIALFSFVLSSTYGEAYAGTPSRRELKQACKSDFDGCKSAGTKASECRKEKRDCRKENGVTFVDDLIYAKTQVQVLIRKVLENVTLELGEDPDLGEYIELDVQSGKLNGLSDFDFVPGQLKSSVGIGHVNGKAEVRIRVYTYDMEHSTGASELQTSPGRKFPRFLGGRVFDSLFGYAFAVGGTSGYQFYIDPKEKVIGVTIPSGAVGQLLSEVNSLKNQIKYVKDIVPNFNSIPLPVTYNKHKVGRISLLSSDSNGKNSGVVILFDHTALVNALKEEAASKPPVP